MAVIVDHGAREMLVEQKDVFYYITLMNENYTQPDLPAGAGADVVKVCYNCDSYLCRFDEGYSPNSLKEVTLLGSGPIIAATDGFGRSDTRAALRGYFGVDAASIAQVTEPNSQSKSEPQTDRFPLKKRGNNTFTL